MRESVRVCQCVCGCVFVKEIVGVCVCVFVCFYVCVFVWFCVCERGRGRVFV